MKDLLSILRTAALAGTALVIVGMALLATWLAAWWLERAIGQALPRFVAALPKKYHPTLLSWAALTVKPRRKDK